MKGLGPSWGTDMSFRFKSMRGRKEVSITKQSWSRCGLVNAYLSSGSSWGLEEIFIACGDKLVPVGWMTAA